MAIEPYLLETLEACHDLMVDYPNEFPTLYVAWLDGVEHDVVSADQLWHADNDWNTRQARWAVQTPQTLRSWRGAGGGCGAAVQVVLTDGSGLGRLP